MSHDVVLDTGPRPGDVDTLYEAWGRWPCTRYWSLRGRAPSPLLISDALADPGHHVQLLRGPGGDLLGVVGVLGLVEAAGYGELDFLVTGEPGRAREVRAALEQAVAAVFATWPALRKLVVEAYADDLPDLTTYLGAGLRAVGRLADHGVTGTGAPVDLLVHEVVPSADRPTATQQESGG
jgi:hypothetical protein